MKYLDIGRVTGLHGVRGKVKVAAFSGDPSGLLAAKTLRLSGGRGTAPGAVGDYEVATAQRAGRLRRFLVQGDRHRRGGGSAGEGGRLHADRRTPSLPEDEFYWIDAVGCLVVDEAGATLGEVVAVEPGMAYDFLVVRRPGGRRGISPWWGPFFARSTRRRGGWSPLRPRGGKGGINVRIDVLTLFPGMFHGPLSHSILGRAAEAGHLAVEVHDLRPTRRGSTG